ncbi:MAG: ROK family protein [Candidatus Omnitrophica bacterium]|nr:ROK family protein [Candidatus Omnitrophota bacterium]
MDSSVKYFKIRPRTDQEQLSAALFNYFRRKKIFESDVIDPELNVQKEAFNRYIDGCVEKGLLKAETSEKKRGIGFNTSGKRVMGIGFRGDKCFLTLMDLGGNIIGKENVRIELLLAGDIRNKDIQGIVKAIETRTTLRDSDLACVGIAMPEEMVKVNPKSMTIFSRGLTQLMNTRVFVTRSATAAGYGDREFCPDFLGTNLLYMYSDVGMGVVLKGEMIFEADEYTEERYSAYLRPWNQYSIVNTTRELVSRGVGTQIVEMVKGDIDAITLEVVLCAAEKKDELAEDLVRRSGLALGIRVAYLVNMFGVKLVIFGGGIEKDEGVFVDSVKKSMSRFLTKEIAKELRMVPGVLGEVASSIGAAALCRRELFMEV